MAVDLTRYVTDDGPDDTVALTCSTCAGVIGRWPKTGVWQLAVEQRKYKHAREAHGESEDV